MSPRLTKPQLSKLGPFFGSLIIIRHLIFRVPRKGAIILTTAHKGYDKGYFKCYYKEHYQGSTNDYDKSYPTWRIRELGMQDYRCSTCSYSCFQLIGVFHGHMGTY